ncbi:MAG TPA: ANTAR domain-containing protein [Candidatus Faecalibacterium avium]|uniref:ANTAR domain-containing response regulator n=1 Tax=Faecalibacterium sp. An58 TaxID=1965648 RepID=UPI000B39E10E|nr:ANTAR domain-containing protein [Faecalibacterium sp. An58]OUN75600.1 antitermination regulator [Faecalibacterium sp. An58]HIV42938.1 ANTAR domain-containing protein [Candidatus Faecalibacterium avium]
MARAMIVSAGASSNEYLSARLTELGYVRPVIVPSGTEARRRMLEGDFELVIVNAPLPDEFGHELCAAAADQTDAGVILLAKAAAIDQLMPRMNQEGVLVVGKPFSAALFLQAVHMAAASNHRLQRLRQENDRIQAKLAQLRLISRAKCLLIQYKQMTEAEAHRLIEKQAMDTRRSRGDVAQDIIDALDSDGLDGV